MKNINFKLLFFCLWNKWQTKKVLCVMLEDGMWTGMFVSDRCTINGKVLKAVGENLNVIFDLEFDVWHFVK